jgi:LCP family protein required for cell wall assembly
MQSHMSNDPGTKSPKRQGPPSPDDPPYRVYRSGRPERQEREEQRPYTLYRSAPKGLRERLRGEQESIESDERRGRGRPSRSARHRQTESDPAHPSRRFHLRGKPITPWRVVRWVVGIIVFWLLLSLVLFLISAQINSGSGLPKSARAALTSGPNMLTGTDTVLVLGLDQRPKDSKEPGAFAGGIRSDSIMLWRIGGGTSRRLSIPRDMVADIPGHGESKINAAYSYGGPALAIKTVEQFTGVKINHLIVVNLANFPKFINAIGGIDVKTGHICDTISGGAKNGGFSLFLKPGNHHLNGTQALTLARTRDSNACDAATNDLTRDAYQQKILNGIKSKLTSPWIVPHLPWTAWAAPQAVRTDMGGFTMLSLFAASEIGGSAPTHVLNYDQSVTLPAGEDAIEASPAAIHRAVRRLMHGK